ncbi:division/cell wall cluster transcriptional repressor MraZ [Palleronia caenipelagi]|uniref:division/cell wall cluster transcriptional repressor MraZ n=1 Tax=Palleronia caenipelagi TaxID=2489174 RepID=UPI00163D60F0|nr:cell division/cell wall cluster transcriptional repressor MraZ [Palleronia caenipelagi]
MVDVFIGSHENKIDSKGRLSIPADFRKILDKRDPDRDAEELPRFVLLFGAGFRDYLEAVPMARLAQVHRQIKRLPPGDPRRKALERLYYQDAQRFVLDDTGRIVLPARARAVLGGAERALVVGCGEIFYIQPFTDDSDPLPEADSSIGYDPATDPSAYLSGDFDDEPDL